MRNFHNKIMSLLILFLVKWLKKHLRRKSDLKLQLALDEWIGGRGSMVSGYSIAKMKCKHCDNEWETIVYDGVINKEKCPKCYPTKNNPVVV